MRRVYTGDPPGAPPDGPVLEQWRLAAIGPSWQPEMGEHLIEPVDGVLEVRSDALVFRADGAIDDATGAPLVAVIPASTVREIGPLSPGNPGSGGWMPRWQRRWRSPGFVVGTEAGAWVFDGPSGPKRADALSRRFRAQ